MYEWNEALHKMNINNSLKGLLRKLKKRNVVVTIYTPMATVGLSQIKTDDDIVNFVNNSDIRLMHIETEKTKVDIDINHYSTYCFNNSKNTLSIELTNGKEIEIQF